jgi:hypothetical protein
MLDTFCNMSDASSAAAASGEAPRSAAASGEAPRSAADPVVSLDAACDRDPLSRAWVVLLVAAIAVVLQIRIPDLRCAVRLAQGF